MPWNYKNSINPRSFFCEETKIKQCTFLKTKLCEISEEAIWESRFTSFFLFCSDCNNWSWTIEFFARFLFAVLQVATISQWSGSSWNMVPVYSPRHSPITKLPRKNARRTRKDLTGASSIFIVSKNYLDQNIVMMGNFLFFFVFVFVAENSRVEILKMI